MENNHLDKVQLQQLQNELKEQIPALLEKLQDTLAKHDLPDQALKLELKLDPIYLEHCPVEPDEPILECVFQRPCPHTGDPAGCLVC